MKPLLTEVTCVEIKRYRETVLRIMADGVVTADERREEQAVGSRAVGTACHAHNRKRLTALLERDGGDIRYLSDLGARAGVRLDELEAA